MTPNEIANMLSSLQTIAFESEKQTRLLEQIAEQTAPQSKLPF